MKTLVLGVWDVSLQVIGQETRDVPKTAWAIAFALGGCLRKLDSKTLLLKPQHTLVTVHTETKLELTCRQIAFTMLEAG